MKRDFTTHLLGRTIGGYPRSCLDRTCRHADFRAGINRKHMMLKICHVSIPLSHVTNRPALTSAKDDAGRSRQYPLNVWYAAAWSSELGRALLLRRICDVALVWLSHGERRCGCAGRCLLAPFAPAFKGRLDGDDVVCGYHGDYAFVRPAAARSCRRRRPSIRPRACGHFRLSRNMRMAWIWMGDPVVADESLIPDLHWNTDPDWTPALGNTIHARNAIIGWWSIT